MVLCLCAIIEDDNHSENSHNIKYKIQIQPVIRKSKFKSDMNDKGKLIESMTNLIHHVSASRRNQQQIFSTLSATDIKKILSNLQDSNERLRKTTLMLLAELLFNNIGLQKKFCQLAGLPPNAAKICLTSNFPKSILYQKQSLTQVFKILKDKSKQSTKYLTQEQNSVFWYIDSQAKPKTLQYGKRNSFNVDPLYCIVGVWVADEEIEQKSKVSSTPLAIKPSFFQSPVNNEMKIGLKVINPLNGKVRLNRSEHIQKQRAPISQKSLITDFSQTYTQNYKQQSKPITPSAKTSLIKIANDEYLTQSMKLQENIQMQPHVPPIILQSQIKNSSKTDTIRYINATERKHYQGNSTPASGYETVRYHHGNTISVQGYGNGNNTGISGQVNAPPTASGYQATSRVPQTSSHRVEGVRTIQLQGPNTTTSSSIGGGKIGQDIKTLVYPRQQYRKI